MTRSPPYFSSESKHQSFKINQSKSKTHQIPNLDLTADRRAQPVAVRREAERVDLVRSVERVEVLVPVQVPQHRLQIDNIQVSNHRPIALMSSALTTRQCQPSTNAPCRPCHRSAWRAVGRDGDRVQVAVVRSGASFGRCTQSNVNQL